MLDDTGEFRILQLLPSADSKPGEVIEFVICAELSPTACQQVSDF